MSCASSARIDRTIQNAAQVAITGETRLLPWHVNTDEAVVLFDRARRKLTSASYTPFVDFRGASAIVVAFGDLIS